MREFFYKSFVVFTLAHLFLNLSAFSNGYCEEGVTRPRYEFGLSLLAGAGDEDGLDIRYYAAYPRLGWMFLDRHAFELEGNIGHYRLDSIDMTSLGLQGLFSYEFYRFEGGKAFIAAGGGLIYLDLDERPQIGDASAVALGQAGIGLKFGIGSRKALRLEYRFQHVSDPFDSSDGGWNYHCFVLGISWLRF
ncbi:MAG: acyloxyacyl hydrolase [Desulfobacteraceae bacterium]|jgi:hypothetical protein